MDVIDLVKEDLCEVNFRVKAKEDLIYKIADMLSREFEHLSAGEIFNALMEREKLGSTGFGDGLAIPHAKLKEIDTFAICIVTLKKGIDFESIDKKKVKVAIAILGPEDRQKDYLRLLAGVSKHVKNKSVLAEMVSAPSVSALKEAFMKSTISMDEINKRKTKNKLLIIHLSEHKYFDDIIHNLLEREVSDAVVTDSSGVESFLAESPLFSGFLNFLAERTGNYKTIMVAVNEEEIPTLVSDIEEIMGDLDKHTGIQLMSLDVEFIKGAISS